MARYIDTEDFKHLINASSLYGTEEWVKVINLLADTPTADVVEARHGMWEPKITDFGTMVFRCSSCKKYSDVHWAFCPRCGAKMDGE